MEHLPNRIWRTQYRPSVKQYCYVDYVLFNRKYQMDSSFPAADSENRAICVPGAGSTKPFSVLVTDTMPDLELISKGQCFPRFRYVRSRGSDSLEEKLSLARIDNITDAALLACREHYDDNTITKDEIFGYVYGVLHSPQFRKRFANDLAKGLQRVPMALNFHAFADAGQILAELHLSYESCEQYPLRVESDLPGEPSPEHYRTGPSAMRFADREKTTLVVNDHIRILGIPSEAHQYKVNGRTPLEWFIDRYRIKQDRESGIINDSNDSFDEPKDLVIAIRRIVHVSVETVRILERLPEPMEPTPTNSVLAALRRSPLVGADIDLTRLREEGREVNL